ncbi:hypothetical protein D6789_02825 [Candidatus Woesearchaeota archaeon]|nr:MAG: hypothetical protein D6789_02825 [Candidatus Woesearchaeota archaeon]
MKYGLTLLLFLLLIPSVIAADLTLSLDQRDYYFRTGEEALVHLHANNTYGEPLNGMLSYTITQTIQQANLQYASSSTQATSFAVGDGATDIPLSFGTSTAPATFSVRLSFSYTKDENRVVNLDEFRIHFVTDEQQAQNQGGGVSSSSEQASPHSTFAQQTQQIMQQMTGQQQSRPQSMQQRIENNQLSQDSKALKKQLAQQLQEQQAKKEAFQQALGKNEAFQQAHQQLLQQGYNLTSASVDPTTNDTGTFSFQYENKKGQKATLSGSMQGGKLQELRQESAERRQAMMEKLQEDARFKQFAQQLQNEGFHQAGVQMSNAGNRTNIRVTYQNAANETADISATLENETVKDVRLTRQRRKHFWWFIPLILLLALVGYLFRNFRKSRQQAQAAPTTEPPFDFHAESLKLLEEAKERFAAGAQKDAYGLACRSLRLYLSYKHGLKKEVTNDELLAFLRRHRKAYKRVKEVFDLCSLVEFAKYPPKKEDFSRIVAFAERTIKS